MTITELIDDKFDFGMLDYKIWDEQYRNDLNSMILSHFIMREICYKNAHRWKIQFNELLNRLMRDEFNMLFKIKDTEFNPLFNVDITESYDGNVVANGKQNIDGNVEFTGNTKNTGLNISTTYPSDEMLEAELTNNIYATNGGRQNGESITNDGTKDLTETTNENDSAQNYVKTTVGSSAGLPFSRAMNQFKDFVENYQLFDELFSKLEPLFYQVYRGEE